MNEPRCPTLVAVLPSVPMFTDGASTTLTAIMSLASMFTLISFSILFRATGVLSLGTTARLLTHIGGSPTRRACATIPPSQRTHPRPMLTWPPRGQTSLVGGSELFPRRRGRDAFIPKCGPIVSHPSPHPRRSPRRRPRGGHPFGLNRRTSALKEPPKYSKKGGLCRFPPEGVLGTSASKISFGTKE